MKLEYPLMNISIIGSRGIPAKYGGYEVFTERLSTKLAKKGSSIIVCCEYNIERMDNYESVRLEYLPYPPPANYASRKLYEILNDTYFFVKMASSSDVMYILGTAAGGMTFLPKLFNRRVRTIINIGGLEWKRDKWNRLEKFLLWLNTMLAVLFVDIIVVDSKAMGKYVGPLGRNKTIFIPYGIEVPTQITWDKCRLNSLGLIRREIMNIEKNNYWLEVARLEPDNNIHVVLEGYLKSESRMPLVIVGDSTSLKYKERLERIVEKGIEKKVFLVGGIYNKELLDMLRQNCFGYIHAHSSGGTNPSLLEAMSFKNIILANDNEFNREVCADSVVYFKSAKDLGEKIELIEKNSGSYLKLKDQVYDRVMDEYSWDKIVNSYIDLFNKIGAIKNY
jgi:rhamnosyltransferase